MISDTSKSFRQEFNTDFNSEIVAINSPCFLKFTKRILENNKE